MLVYLAVPSLSFNLLDTDPFSSNLDSVRIGLYETLKEQTKSNTIPASPPVLELLAVTLDQLPQYLGTHQI
jgi:hypothetical protein